MLSEKYPICVESKSALTIDEKVSPDFLGSSGKNKIYKGSQTVDNSTVLYSFRTAEVTQGLCLTTFIET